MSNVEHPKHYQLSINLEVLDIIKIIMTDGHLNAYQGFVIGNVIKYLFRADKKNGLEDYKKALYYLKKIISDSVYPTYTDTEKKIIEKVLMTVENKKIRNIIDEILFLHLHSSQKSLESYIEEQEKKDDKEN